MLSGRVYSKLIGHDYVENDLIRSMMDMDTEHMWQERLWTVHQG